MRSVATPVASAKPWISTARAGSARSGSALSRSVARPAQQIGGEVELPRLQHEGDRRRRSSRAPRARPLHALPLAFKVLADRLGARGGETRRRAGRGPSR